MTTSVHIYWCYIETWESFLLTLPTLLPPSVLLSSAVCFSLSHPLSLLLSVLFSLILSPTSQCATLELQQSVIVRHAEKAAWSRPVISSHCPCAVTCTKEHQVREERRGKERWMEKGAGEKRQRVDRGVLRGMGVLGGLCGLPPLGQLDTRLLGQTLETTEQWLFTLLHTL